MNVGIEKINFYTGSLVLDVKKIAEARGKDAVFLERDLMILKNSQNVNYEDVITLAVNAAKPILTEQDKKDIELCVFATESGLDFCKSNSTYVCKYLDLKSNIRTFEIKNACYAATCGIDIAINWIRSGAGKGKKALILASDISYDHEGRPGEELPSVGAVALLISDQPEIIEYEIEKSGLYMFECVDYARPTSKHDIIHGQESLFAYLECLEGAFDHYKSKVGNIDINSYFKRIVYHTPFGGLVKAAHDSLLLINYPSMKKKERRANIAEKVEKSLEIAKIVGNTYSSSLYVSLLSLLLNDDELQSGDRIGMFSYGSGACGEFYSVLLLPGAQKYIKSLEIEHSLNNRYELNLEEFDKILHENASYVDNPNFEVDLLYPPGWYEQNYKDKGLLVLKSVKEFIREYEWS